MNELEAFSEFAVGQALTLATRPINEYLVFELANPKPQLYFAIPTPLYPGKPEDNIIPTPPHLEIAYELFRVIGTLAIYKYNGWKVTS